MAYWDIYYLYMEQFLVLYMLMGFFSDRLGQLVYFLPLFRTSWFVSEDYALVIYYNVGYILEDILLGQRLVVSIELLTGLAS
jgi:hypothetical protein